MVYRMLIFDTYNDTWDIDGMPGVRVDFEEEDYKELAVLQDRLIRQGRAVVVFIPEEDIEE